MIDKAEYSQQQWRAISAKRPIRQIVAAAGSGKTRTVVGLVAHQLEEGMLAPEEILCLSFSRKAAGELRHRLHGVGARVEISTFHSFCFRHLVRLDPRFQGATLLEERERDLWFREILGGEGETIGGIPFRFLSGDLPGFRRRFPDLSMRVLRAFHRYKRSNRLFEYDDLIYGMLSGLRDDAGHLQELRKRYRLIVVDEFQDTDPAQVEFLKQMNAQNLVVVGDARQAIYGFRGATVEPFLRFPRIFRGARLFSLNENYRSLKRIVSLGNRVSSLPRKRLRGRVSAVRGRGPGYPILRVSTDDSSMNEWVRQINENDGAMVLVRTNARLRAWCRAGLREDRVMTIHRSKGLEFRVVILDLIGGWSESLPASLREPRFITTDEELRILYVGITRAQNMLVALYNESASEGRVERRIIDDVITSRSRRASMERAAQWMDLEKDQSVDVA